MSKLDIVLKNLLFVEGEFDIEEFITSISGELVKSAQKVYDEWEQDEEGYSEEYGSGGICDRVADEMSDTFSELNTSLDWESFTMYDEYECHTDFYVVNHKTKDIIKVGLAPHYYESGGGYTWKKIPNVKLEPSMLNIDSAYLDYENFFNDDEEMLDF